MSSCGLAKGYLPIGGVVVKGFSSWWSSLPSRASWWRRQDGALPECNPSVRGPRASAPRPPLAASLGPPGDLRRT